MGTSKLMSIVPGHGGYCRPVWLNRNQLDIRIHGGVSGFFRTVKPMPFFPVLTIKTGPEFHGIVRDRNPGVVEPGVWPI